MFSTIISVSSFFFFSSRRRHTRLQGDWSSDVCSSDLEKPKAAVLLCHPHPLGGGTMHTHVVYRTADALREARSEERRVGKECRSGVGRRDEEKKRTDRNRRISEQRNVVNARETTHIVE